MNQTFEESRSRAHDYASHERRYRRYIPHFILFTIVSAVLAFWIAPLYIVASLAVSAASYLSFRHGHSIATQARHAWLTWKAQRQSPSKFISMEALLPAHSHDELVHMAKVKMTRDLNNKSEKIKRYEVKSNLEDDLDYYDFKHKRALFQYSMLQSTKEMALRGRGDFITQREEEKTSRRNLKIAILEMLKSEFIGSKKLSLILKYTPHSSAGACTLGGTQDNQSALLAKMIQLNDSADYPLIELPTDPIEKNQALLNTLLPLVLDMDHVIQHVPALNKPVSSHIGKLIVHYEKHFPIGMKVIEDRIARLSKDVDERENKVFNLV